MSQIAFDENMVGQLEAAYRARDVLRRRELVYAALGPRPGERILDVGCGPGFYVAELLDLVGVRPVLLRRDAAGLGALGVRSATQRSHHG